MKSCTVLDLPSISRDNVLRLLVETPKWSRGMLVKTIANQKIIGWFCCSSNYETNELMMVNELERFIAQDQWTDRNCSVPTGDPVAEMPGGDRANDEQQWPVVTARREPWFGRSMPRSARGGLDPMAGKSESEQGLRVDEQQ